MLSLAYAMLTRHLTIALASVGLDPYRGFYHAPRYGRPALALDLMEPFRAIIADSVVLSAEWIQLSVFQCRLSQRRRAELETRLRELVRNGEDHVLLIDVGPADKIELAMESIGKTFSKMERRATVI